MKHNYSTLDHIEVFCTPCREKMVPESVFNGNDGFFKCLSCDLRIHVYVHSEKEES